MGPVAGFAQRTGLRLTADPSRVVIQLFVPGQEGFEHQQSRATPVTARLMALPDDEVERCLAEIFARFSRRHRHLDASFRDHADAVADRLTTDDYLSGRRRLLLGATFSSEYAIEGAALCNPSMVPHPDQTDLPAGSVRFVMSVRGIGEGHRSSIGFRTGTIAADGSVTIDEPTRFASVGVQGPALLDAVVFRSELHRLRVEGEDADFVLDGLGEQFDATALQSQLVRLESQLATRQHGASVAALMRQIAARTYQIQFPTDVPLGERVLRPAMAAETIGMEDARFVRFVDDDGAVTYVATYTAYNGHDISGQLLRTADFVTFVSAPLVGPAAANKGLAIFPRKIDGKYVAMSRSDRETNSVTTTTNPLLWETATCCQVPVRSWEVLQLGNCGSPIETEAGWLVLTHGVGPMRTYSIGAILLDLHDPTIVLGELNDPLLTPSHDEQDGYVPNVVYSCGAMRHDDHLVIPYGIGDAAIGIATASISDLLSRITAQG